MYSHRRRSRGNRYDYMKGTNIDRVAVTVGLSDLLCII